MFSLFVLAPLPCSHLVRLRDRPPQNTKHTQPWDGAEAIEGLEGRLVGIARKLNAAESPLKLAGNFGTKHNSCLAFAHAYDVIVVVRSDDENLKGISIFSHAALKLNPPECYHLVVPGQQNNADDLQKFRALRYGRTVAKPVGMANTVKFVHTPLAYVSENEDENSIAIPASIARVAFKNVVETAVQVSGHEGVWHEGVFMILAANTRMSDVTVPLKGGQMVDQFVAAGHTFGLEDVCVKFKGQLQDLMGWGDVVVVDHQGAVVGIARGCNAVESPLTVGDNFDVKYDAYLKFAHRHECVMVVRSDLAANGICVFSHEALVGPKTPECYRIVTVGRCWVRMRECHPLLLCRECVQAS